MASGGYPSDNYRPASQPPPGFPVAAEPPYQVYQIPQRRQAMPCQSSVQVQQPKPDAFFFMREPTFQYCPIGQPLCQQAPSPNYFIAQPIQPATFPYLGNMQEVTYTPPVQPQLFPSGPPVFHPAAVPEALFVNITVPQPLNCEAQPYIVSIPVPAMEFSPITLQRTFMQQFLPQPLTAPVPVQQGDEAEVQPLVQEPSEQDPQAENNSQSENGESQPSAQNDGAAGADTSCRFCRGNRETSAYCYTHVLHDLQGRVICPILRNHVCRICYATGDNAHTMKYCPRQKRNSSPVEDIDAIRPGIFLTNNAVGRVTIRRY